MAVAGIYKGLIKRQIRVLTGTPPNTFRAATHWGWTATYYLQQADYAAAFAALDSINTAELALYPSNVGTSQMTVSDVGVKGDVSHGTVPISTPWGTYVPTSGPGDNMPMDPNLGLSVTLFAGVNYRSNRWMRGLLDALVVTQERSYFTPDVAWITAYSAYSKALQVDAVHLLRGVDPNGNPTYNGIPISTLTPYKAGISYPMSIRKVGRPFDLPRGRRTTC